MFLALLVGVPCLLLLRSSSAAEELELYDAQRLSLLIKHIFAKVSSLPAGNATHKCGSQAALL